MNNESQNDSKVVTVYLVNLYIYLSLIFFMSNWFVVYFMTINKTDFIISTLYFGPPLIILITYLFRHRTLKFAYEHENEIKLLGSFMRLFLYIFTTRFFYGLNGNTKTMKGVYIFCFQASLISFYVSFTIRNSDYLSSLLLWKIFSLFTYTILENLVIVKDGNNSTIIIPVAECKWFSRKEYKIVPVIKFGREKVLSFNDDEFIKNFDHKVNVNLKDNKNNIISQIFNYKYFCTIYITVTGFLIIMGSLDIILR